MKVSMPFGASPNSKERKKSGSKITNFYVLSSLQNTIHTQTLINMYIYILNTINACTHNIN
jgi:hypothetical protein